MIEQGKTFSHLQLVMDDEIHAMVKLVLGGISTADEYLAVEAIDRVGPGGNFLIDDLTLKHFKSERFFSRLMLREARQRWEAKGCKSFRERARERVKQILATHQPAPLDPLISKEISALAASSETILRTA